MHEALSLLHVEEKAEPQGKAINSCLRVYNVTQASVLVQ